MIKDVPKTLVYELCRRPQPPGGRELIPEAVLTKPPSAELRPDQRDDQSLPPYEVLDPILEAYVEGDRTRGELVAAGYDPDLVRRIARLVDRPSTSAGSRRRACGCPARRSARTGACRSPIATPVERGARRARAWRGRSR